MTAKKHFADMPLSELENAAYWGIRERTKAREVIHLAIQNVPQLPQRQDSLEDQLADLIPIANRLGLYDAATYLQDRAKRHR